MKSVNVLINTVDKVKSFVRDITKFENEFDLVSGKYVVNAKSIMGVFSLDLTQPLNVIIHDATMKDVARLQKAMEEFRVDEI